MCLAIPGQVVEINGRKASVRYPTTVNFGLINDEQVKIGDWVMVQMGIIVKKVSPKEAQIAIDAWMQLDRNS